MPTTMVNSMNLTKSAYVAIMSRIRLMVNLEGLDVGVKVKAPRFVVTSFGRFVLTLSYAYCATRSSHNFCNVRRLHSGNYLGSLSLGIIHEF